MLSKKIKVVIIVLCLAIFAITAAVITKKYYFNKEAIKLENVSENIVLEKTYREGKLYQAGNVNVVTLRGSYREMGQQYGTLMKDEINALYNLMAKEISAKGIANEQLKAAVIDPSWRGMSKRHREIFYGLTESTGLTTDQLVVVDQNLLVGAQFPDKFFPSGACSYAAAWGDFTKDNKLYAARNLDWTTSYKDYGSYFTVAIFQPNDGSNSVANIGYAGWVSLATGINDKGLFLEINDGTHSAGSKIYSDMMSTTHSTLEFLFDSDTIEDFDMRIKTTRINWPFIISIADKNVSYSYENSVSEVKKRSADEEGFIALANDFMLPDWNITPDENDVTFSPQRYRNLIAFGQENKGEIDIEAMKTMLESPIVNEDGSAGSGTTFYDYEASPGVTAYQVIATPEDKKVWVRVPGYNDWTFIDLEAFFGN